MELEPEQGCAFLFFNTLQNKIKMFYVDETGSHEMMKVLPKGGFLIPVSTGNEKFIRIEKSKISSLFRM